MTYFPRLDELAVAANSRVLFEGMLVYCDRDNTRDLEFSNGLENLWVELLERTNKRQLFITKLEGLCPSAKRENTWKKRERVKVAPLVPKVSIRHVDPKDFMLHRWSLSGCITDFGFILIFIDDNGVMDMNGTMDNLEERIANLEMVFAYLKNKKMLERQKNKPKKEIPSSDGTTSEDIAKFEVAYKSTSSTSKPKKVTAHKVVT
nr:hypothetical protein [Tanacetum cinerariifolium]